MTCCRISRRRTPVRRNWHKSHSPPLLPSNEAGFSVHSDDAPTVYINGNPGPNDASTRKLEQDLAALKAPDPYVNNGAMTSVTYQLADPAEERALHMVNADPARTPTFTDFGKSFGLPLVLPNLAAQVRVELDQIIDRRMVGARLERVRHSSCSVANIRTTALRQGV